jgi:hypothetical protein
MSLLRIDAWRNWATHSKATTTTPDSVRLTANEEQAGYGIDIDARSVRKAIAMFPSEEDHFACLSLKSLSLLELYGLPNRFDFVFWNVGNNLNFMARDDIRCVEMSLRALRMGGRLILGFYDESSGVRQSKIKRLIALGFALSGRICNSTNTREAIWIEC